MAVLGPETCPDGPGLSWDSVFWPDQAKRILAGPVRPTVHFRGRPTTPSGGKSVAWSIGLRSDGPDGLPATVAGPLAGWLNRPENQVAPA